MQVQPSCPLALSVRVFHSPFARDSASVRASLDQIWSLTQHLQNSRACCVLAANQQSDRPETRLLRWINYDKLDIFRFQMFRGATFGAWQVEIVVRRVSLALAEAVR